MQTCSIIQLVADAREALQSLTLTAKSAGVKPDSDYANLVAETKLEWEARLRSEVYRQVPGEAMSQQHLIGILNEVAQEGDTIICAAGTAPGDLHQLWDATAGRNCHLEYGYSCMGYELPASVGVRMAQPEGEVYAFVGDGTYLMNPMEIVTAVQEGLKITVILSNNHGFQSIHRLQRGRTGRSFGNEFRLRVAKTDRLEGEFLSIDFVKNAESMGARTWSVQTEQELRAALAAARRETRTSVIVVETEKYRYQPDSGVWWDVEAAEVSNDPLTQELRVAYEDDREKRQRFYY